MSILINKTCARVHILPQIHSCRVKEVIAGTVGSFYMLQVAVISIKLLLIWARIEFLPILARVWLILYLTREPVRAHRAEHQDKTMRVRFIRPLPPEGEKGRREEKVELVLQVRLVFVPFRDSQCSSNFPLISALCTTIYSVVMVARNSIRLKWINFWRLRSALDNASEQHFMCEVSTHDVLYR